MQTKSEIFSIFDTYNKMEDPNSTFAWKNPPVDFALKKEDIVHSGFMNEIDNSGIVLPQKFYVATVNSLFRFPDMTTNIPEAELRLCMSRLKILNAHNTDGFTLKAHEISIKFLVNVKEERANWYNKLSKQCKVILVHFSRYYKLFKTIQHTKYFDIKIATDINSNNTYLVKSLPKTQLLNSLLRLVNVQLNSRKEPAMKFRC